MIELATSFVNLAAAVVMLIVVAVPFLKNFDRNLRIATNFASCRPLAGTLAAHDLTGADHG